MKLFGPLALAACFATGSAYAATVEFDTNNGLALSHGSFVGDGAFDFGSGITGTITTTGGLGTAQVYDTGNSGGLDTDLESPQNSSGDTYDGGNALMIATGTSTETNPNDHGGGGTIVFAFQQDVIFSGITLIDGENNQQISVTTNLGTLPPPLDIPVVQGDDMFDVYVLNPSVTVNTITVNFGGSGALDRLVLENPNFQAIPVPAGLPLLVSGIGVFGLLRSRRKRST